MTDAAQSSDRSLALAYEAEERRRKLYSFVMVLLAVAVLVAGLRAVEDANAGSFIDGLSQFFDYPIDILSGAWAAGWNWFPLLLKYFPYLVETINMALVSTFFGFLGAFVITFVGSRNLVPYGPVVWVARRIMDVSRAFPEIVIALFLLFIFSPTPLAAVIAIAFHTVGALGKLFSELVENADMKLVEGLAASGGSWLQRVWFGVVPQVMPNFLSYTLLRLEINVRASAIMGFVGAGGLGQQFNAVTDWKYGDDMSAILVLLIASIFLIDGISSRLRQRLIGTGGHGWSPLV